MARAKRADRVGPWVVARGAALRRCSDGLIATAQGAHLRVAGSSGTNEAEKRPRQGPTRLWPGSAGSAQLLRARSVIHSLELRADVLDLAAIRPLDRPFHVRNLKRVANRRPGLPLVVVADAEDPEFRAIAGVLEPPFVAVWLSPRSAAVLAAWSPGAACAACALRFDGEIAETALPDSWAEGSRVLSPHVQALGRLLAQLTLASPDWQSSQRIVRWIDVDLGGVRSESVPWDPTCDSCGTRPASEPAVTASWEAYESKRFAPLRVLRSASPDAPHRALYRGSRSLSRIGRSAFGVAIATGPFAAERTVAEGVERLCFLRPPVHHVGSADAIRMPRLDDRSIEALLFPAVAYQRSGFRVAPYQPALEISWSLAQRVRDGEHLLVPTDFVGPARQGRRLVDATTNGFAAHPDRASAIEHALFELVERDSLLLAWFGAERLVRIENARAGPCELLLVPTDLDVPVIVAWSRNGAGQIRMGTAGRGSIDDAIAAAVQELDIAIRAGGPTGPVPDLDDASGRIGPLDHVRYYNDPPHEAALAAFLTRGDSVDLDELRSRWPKRGEAPETLANRLLAVGLDPLVVDAGRPELVGSWSVVRALVPGLLELSWGRSYLRVASERVWGRLNGVDLARALPHPFG